MKPEDLMVGDWVEMNFYQPQPSNDYPDEDWQPYQIKSGKEIDEYAQYVQPLLLTEDIIKKSGFKFCAATDDIIIYQDRDTGLAIQFDKKDMKCPVIAYDIWWSDNGLMTSEMMDVEYVHELQHAIKSMKLNIELCVR